MIEGGKNKQANEDRTNRQEMAKRVYGFQKMSACLKQKISSLET